jgi:hypothetical protein
MVDVVERKVLKSNLIFVMYACHFRCFGKKINLYFTMEQSVRVDDVLERNETKGQVRYFII